MAPSSGAALVLEKNWARQMREQAARLFFFRRFIQLLIRFLASASASFRDPLKFTTLGLPPTLSGNDISKTHSFRPGPARMA